jgi:hypothetical protein
LTNSILGKVVAGLLTPEIRHEVLPQKVSLLATAHDVSVTGLCNHVPVRSEHDETGYLCHIKQNLAPLLDIDCIVRNGQPVHLYLLKMILEGLFVNIVTDNDNDEAAELAQYIMVIIKVG